MLRGRDRQRAAVDALLERARAGHGGALVLRGEPGSGKTAMLAAAREVAEGAAGVPVLCVDDAHELARVDDLLALAHELAGTPAALLVATEGDTYGLPTVHLDPLDHAASLRVLRDLRPGLPASLADELIALACGMPLALVELAAALTDDQLGGTTPAPEVLPADSSLRARLRDRFAALSPAARRAVALVAVDDEVDVDTLVRLPDLGIAAIEEAQPLLDDRPLVRGVVRAELPLGLRFAAHNELAEVLPPGPRRTWHQAALLPGARDEHAGTIIEAARHARRCGDYGGAARHHDRAATLCTDPVDRARHLVSAAVDHWAHGSPRRARALLRVAARMSDNTELRARTELVRGGIELGDGVPEMAVQRLVRAAEQLAGTNRGLAVYALGFAGEAASIAGDHVRHAAVAEFAAGLRRTDEPEQTRLTLDHIVGMAATFAGRYDEAVPLLRSVVDAAERTADPQARIWGSQAAYALGDATRSHELATGAVLAARESGLTGLVPWALVYQALAALLVDQYAEAHSAAFEGVHAATAIGQHNTVVDHQAILALLAALRGDTETALHRIDAAAEQIAQRGLGRPGTFGAWAIACVDLALDRPADALDRLRLVASGGVHAGIKVLAAPHMVEAAVGCGNHAVGDRALRRYDAWAGRTGSTARLALSHRCRGLLAVADDGEDADEHFREAIRLHRASGTALELAKTELLYGTRLRRERKPRLAREHLREAVRIFRSYEADHWVARASAELRAAGETVTGRPRGAMAELTPQQAQIARLVAEGATNREIAARLFLSHRTVEHHLRNIFARVQVRSRVELARLFDQD